MRGDSRDIALLKVAVADVPWLQVSTDAACPVGTEIIAIGAPYALDHTLSKGIVSAYREEADVPYLQTDAALNPGNSGGPVISLESGEVVGMVVSGVRKDISEGLNFAISSPSLRAFLGRQPPFQSAR